MTEARRVVVGEVTGAFGIQGWVRVRSHTRPESNLAEYAPWWIGGSEFKVIEFKPQSPGWVARLNGVDDRDAAAALARRAIEVDRERLPAPATDEIYWADLIGLRVIGIDDCDLGRVTDMMETAAHDVMVIDDGGRQRLIPFVRGPIVEAVEPNDGVVRVQWAADYD